MTARLWEGIKALVRVIAHEMTHEHRWEYVGVEELGRWSLISKGTWNLGRYHYRCEACGLEWGRTYYPGREPDAARS